MDFPGEKTNHIKKIVGIGVTYLFLGLLMTSVATAGELKLQWDQNNEKDLAGYKVYQRKYNKYYNYLVPVWDGEDNFCTISDLEEGEGYCFVVRAYNLSGVVSKDSNEVCYQPDDPQITDTSSKKPKIEFGSTSVNHKWQRVVLTKDFTDPVVVANGLTLNGADPSVIRIRNVNSNGFDIRVQEYPYLNGYHTFEKISYLVMERGCYELADGTLLEAGTFQTNKTTAFDTIYYEQPFNDVPVVLTSTISFNELDAVTGRLHGITRDRFQYKLQEQELNKTGHNATESVAYIAWETSSGIIDGMLYEIGVKSNSVTHNPKNIHTRQSFNGKPEVIADMQTCNGNDPATIRFGNIEKSVVEVQVYEERSADNEIWHKAESVGYIFFDSL